MTFRLFRPAMMRLAAAILLVMPAGPAGAGMFDPETFTLDNGMQVAVVSNHRVPVVTHMVWYKVGAADEPAGQSGIAHVLEHLMFKGTENLAPGEFSEIVARNGGQENAFTSSDYTGYYQTIARDRLETVMRLEAERMTKLRLTEDVVRPEVQVVMEERRQRTENNPGAILREHADAAQFLNHPYRRPVIGWEHELEALTVDAILRFYRRWYAPDNAVLVVAGDITADELRPLAEKYYGDIPPSGAGDRARPQEPPQRAQRRVSLADEKVRQPSWSRTWLAPGYLTGATEHAHALEVLAQAFGGGSTSRLYRSLVVEQGLAVSAGAHYDPDVRGPAQFTVYASPRPGVSLDDLEAAVEREVDRLLADGLPAEDIARAKTGMVAEAVYARDELSSGARILGQGLAIGRSVEAIDAWPERIEAVTPEAVAAAARRVIDRDSSVTSLLKTKEAE